MARLEPVGGAWRRRLQRVDLRGPDELRHGLGPDPGQAAGTGEGAVQPQDGRPLHRDHRVHALLHLNLLILTKKRGFQELQTSLPHEKKLSSLNASECKKNAYLSISCLCQFHFHRKKYCTVYYTYCMKYINVELLV